MSISGYSNLFPGLEGGYQRLSNGGKMFIALDEKYEYRIKKGFKIIAGTSDMIDSSAPPLQSVAYEYAKKYNMLLINMTK